MLQSHITIAAAVLRVHLSRFILQVTLLDGLDLVHAADMALAMTEIRRQPCADDFGKKSGTDDTLTQRNHVAVVMLARRFS